MRPDDPNTRESAITDVQMTASIEDMPQKVYDCWNTIGVEGNGSCRELAKFVHCRNCPVYSEAALQLLDRPLLPEYRREWTEFLAREKKTGSPAKLSVVIFRIESDWLALLTAAFQEIAEHRAMHTLPHRRGTLALGLVNIRGELTICASLQRLLGFQQGTTHLRKSHMIFDRLLVTHWNGGRLAFPVDEVHGIERFREDELRDPPATIARSSLTYTQGVIAWRGRTIGMLNADTLFASLNRNLS